MRLSPIVPALAMALSTGCSSLVSLDPFITEQEAVLDKALTGVWQNAKGDDTYVIRQDNKGYSILYLSEGTPAPAHFRALLLRTGNAELLDLVSTDENDFQLPLHSLVRVWPEGTTLRWTFLDSDWMKEQARPLPKRTSGDRTIIAATGDAVHALMLKTGADDRASQGGETLTRVQ